MSIDYRRYLLKLRVNGVCVREVRIDPHVDKHSDITDELILELVKTLGELDGILDDDEGRGFCYFVDFIELNKKCYKLVWLLEQDENYVGVVTAHRVRRKK